MFREKARQLSPKFELGIEFMNYPTKEILIFIKIFIVFRTGLFCDFVPLSLVSTF